MRTSPGPANAAALARVTGGTVPEAMYRRIAGKLRGEIESGRLEPGTPLPSGNGMQDACKAFA